MFVQKKIILTFYSRSEKPECYRKKFLHDRRQEDSKKFFGVKIKKKTQFFSYKGNNIKMYVSPTYNTIGELVVYSLMDVPVHTATHHCGNMTLD